MRAFWGWNPVVQFAAAAAVLICIAGGAWLVSENAAIRSRVAALEAERRGFEAREQSLRQQLGEEQNRAAALAAQNRQPSEAARAPLVASLVLVPGLSRAPTRVEQLVLSSSVQIARIEIELESRDDFPRFRAELRTRRGEEVLSRSNLVRRKSGPGFAVSVDVPASALAVGDYELALKGSPPIKPVRMLATTISESRSAEPTSRHERNEVHAAVLRLLDAAERSHR